MPDFSELYNPEIKSAPMPEAYLTEIINPFDNFNPNVNGPGGPGGKGSASSVLDGLFTKLGSPTVESMTDPIAYDPVATKRERYNQSAYRGELGFDPFTDNETKYGERQTWGNTIGNALGGAGTLAANTFVESWKGWGNLASALFDWDNGTFGERLTGSPAELMAIDQEQKRVMDKYAIFETPESRDGIFNRQFLGSMIQQGGFTFGTLAAFATEELLTMGMSTAFSSAKLGIGMAKVGGKYMRAAELIKDAKRLGDVSWKTTSFTKGILNGAKKVIPLLDTGQSMARASKAGAGALQIAAIGVGGVRRTLSEANMAFTEARMEAAGTYGGLYERLLEEAGDNPSEQTLQRIETLAQQAAQENFAINSGILMAANKIQFDNLFKKFKTDRVLSKTVDGLDKSIIKISGEVGGKQTTRLFDKHFLGAAGRYREIRDVFGKGVARWEAAKSIGKGLSKWELSEGLQELMQESSNSMAENYYYDLYHGSQGFTRGEALEEAVAEQNSIQGVKTFLMGALTGRMISPITAGIGSAVDRIKTTDAQRQEEVRSRQETISIINNFYKDPTNVLKPEIANFKVQTAASQNMMEATEVSDPYTYYNSKDSALNKLVASAHKAGMVDSILDTIREYGDHFTPEEFKEAYGIDVAQEGILSVSDYFNTIADKVEEYSNTYEALMDKYSDLVQPGLFEEGTEQYAQAIYTQHALHDAIEILASHKTKAQRAIARAQELYDTVGKIPSIGGSSVQAFEILKSEANLDYEIKLLSDSIKSLKESILKDEATTTLLAQKEAELAQLSAWKNTWNKTEEDGNLEKAYEAFTGYIKAKNKAAGLEDSIREEDTQDAFKAFVDFNNLNKDNQEYVDAYNMLANPTAFASMHNKLTKALEATVERLKAEHIAEATKGTSNNSLTYITDAGPQTIKEGEFYITAAQEKDVIFGKGTAKTYNNNILEILSIDEPGDKITVKVNYKDTYIVSKKQLESRGKLWALSEMTPAQRVYFKNRDKVLKVNVSKFGKPHSMKGEHAKKNYSKSGVVVSGRLKLEKEGDAYNLKFSYINPVTKKVEVVPFDSNYFAKYGVDKIDLRGNPVEVKDAEVDSARRRETNLTAQEAALSAAIQETEAKLTENQTALEQVDGKFSSLQQEVADLQIELELALDDLSRETPYVRGGKKKSRRILEETIKKIQESLPEKEALLVSLANQLETLKSVKETLSSTREHYYTALDQITETEEPYDRNGGATLTSELEKELAETEANQVTSRLGEEKIDILIAQTDDQIALTEERINVLKDLIKKLKEHLWNFSALNDILEHFQGLPADLSNRTQLRNYLRDKIKTEKDEFLLEEYEKLMKIVLRGGEQALDLKETLMGLQKAVTELAGLNTKLTGLKEKADRLAQASLEKEQINTIKDKIDFLKIVEEGLRRGVNLIKGTKPAKKVAKKSSKTEEIPDTGNSPSQAITNGDIVFTPSKPLLRNGMFKSASRHMNADDTAINSPQDGRYHKFATDTAHKGLFFFQSVTEANDEYGIREPEFYDKDIKLIVTRIDPATGLHKPVGVDGEILSNPTKDNIVYTSMVGDQKVLEATNEEVLAYLKSPESPWITNGMTDAEILATVGEFKGIRNKVLQSSNPLQLEIIGISGGVQSREPKEVYFDEEGKEQERVQKLPTKGRLIEENPKDWANLKHPDGSPIKLKVITKESKLTAKIPEGRIALVKESPDSEMEKSLPIQVYNRPLSESEKGNTISLLARLTDLFGRKNQSQEHKDRYAKLLQDGIIDQLTYDKMTTPLSEEESQDFTLILDHLMGTLFWKPSKDDTDVRNNQFFIKNGKLVKIEGSTVNGKRVYTKFMVDFDAASIFENRDRLMEGVYHIVNNKYVEKVDKPYYEVQIDSDGDLNQRKWDNYTEYLLSDKGGRQPIVYTNIVPYSTEIEKPQLKSVYLSYSTSNEELGKPIQETVPDFSPELRDLIAKGIVEYKDNITGEICPV